MSGACSVVSMSYAGCSACDCLLDILRKCSLFYTAAIILQHSTKRVAVASKRGLASSTCEFCDVAC